MVRIKGKTLVDSNCQENSSAEEYIKYAKNAVVQLELYFTNLKKNTFNTDKAKHLINYLVNLLK